MIGGIEILYSCHRCKLDKAPVRVPYRESSRDVVDWMQKVAIIAVAADHMRRSPHCKSRLCDLRIPVPAGTDWIGGPVVN